MPTLAYWNFNIVVVTRQATFCVYRWILHTTGSVLTYNYSTGVTTNYVLNIGGYVR